MEKSNFNKAYIYIIGIFAIGIAISNVITFFGGMGFALIGASILLSMAIINILKDEANKKRFGDIFILLSLEFILFIILFFAYDFNLNGLSSKFPLVIRNICAIYSLIAFGYILFRFISEIKGKRYNFIEYILGNYTPAPKEKKIKPTKAEIKKNKELENGTLEPKPSSLENPMLEINTEDEEIVLDDEQKDSELKDVDENKQIEEVNNSSEAQNDDTENSQSNTTNNNYNSGFWH